MTELGILTTKAAFAYLAGLRSRVAATELARVAPEIGNSVDEVRLSLRDSAFIRGLTGRISNGTLAWVDLLLVQFRVASDGLPKCADFALSDPVPVSELYARTLGKSTFLCSLDGRFKVEVGSNDDFPFSKLADRASVSFVKDGDSWQMRQRDPRSRS